MARQTSEAVLGFFPFPPPCLPLLVSHLEPTADPSETVILDPCAGEGVAIDFLARHLAVPEENVYLVELSESRTDVLKRTFPQKPILGPASFVGTGIGYNAFSLTFVNPPFADELGGGRREELTFLVKAINHTSPHGIVVLVLPEPSLFGYQRGPEDIRRAIQCRLEDAQSYALPQEHRKYKEVVVIGRKRRQPVPEGEGPMAGSWWEARLRMGVLGEATKQYKVPAGRRPKRWEQTAFTEEELKRKVAASPLGALLLPQVVKRGDRPPLPPGKGHTALVLVSGDLDGLVCPPGEPPHILRGTSRKVRFRDEAKCEEHDNEDGSYSRKEVYSERGETVVRAVDVHGKIHTFTDHPEDHPEDQDEGSNGSAPDAQDDDES